MQYALLIILAVLFVGISALMMLIILIQRPKGGGLSGAFGGAGGSADAAFGAKTGDVLTYLTVAFFVAFLLVAVGLQWVIHPDSVPFGMMDFLNPASNTAAPATPAATGETFDPATAIPLDVPDPESLDVEFAPIDVVEPDADAATPPADAATDDASTSSPATP
ncbi:MAG: preprotein translocase subunit SecG [Planctomycetota bacterium]